MYAIKGRVLGVVVRLTANVDAHEKAPPKAGPVLMVAIMLYASVA